jgi:MacB-like periplasmic core domain/FtsX-like permease family
VLTIGFAALVVFLGVFAALIARRRLQRAEGRRRDARLPVASRMARLASEAGLPVSAVVGVRFALEPGRDRDAAPVRSALVGAALAVSILVATVTFGSSLSTLVSHPSLYGWNWNYALAGNGSGVPPEAAQLLKADPYVAQWSGDDFANAQINGVTVPIILTNYHAVVSAPLLSGHEVDGPGQIVLGPATLKELHKSVGDYVIAKYGSSKNAPVYVPPTKMRIVGVATLPAIGATLSLHSEMGVGAFVPRLIEPPAFRKYLHAPYEALNGYSDLFVRLKKGAPRAAALASLERIAHVGTKDLTATPGGGGEEVSVLGVQYPAEIENYRAIGVTPDVLALALALGAVVALALALIATVQRRRRDLALLRTLGFTSRQLAATVASQASVAAISGIIVGVPVGIIAGRWLWNLFARSVYVVPEPTIPVLSVVLVSLGALVLANIVAALPGRSAARTSTARILRGE